MADDTSPVTVSLEDLKRGGDSVSFADLEKAFGPDSLGIIIVKDLPPQYKELRHRLLSYSSYLANLSQSELAKLENSPSKYLVGWSLGKETLKSGQFDKLKGSYYVNCAFYQDRSLQNAPSENFPTFPEYTTPNVWPTEDILPGYRATFEALCSLIIDVAVLVARACDRYATKNIEGYQEGYLQRVVESSMTTKARLLHYFPPSASQEQQPEDDADSWCATHRDHGCLTGLTSAMYVDEAENVPKLDAASGTVAPLAELPVSPDPDAGLYIHSRTGKITKVGIPRDCLAFQTGEALESITKGRFKAVPHFVRGPSLSNAGQVARNTLAVFTQPNLWEVVDQDRGVNFAGFAHAIIEKNH